MASNTYCDMFTYGSFVIVMNTRMIEYSDVTLLKNMCGKKTGTKLDKIVLNPRNGSWSIPVSAAAPSPKKYTFVEFKGVHTRFEDDEEEDLVYIPRDVPSSTFKMFQGRKRVKCFNTDFSAYEEFSKYIRELGCGSKDTIVVNHSNDLIRVAGIYLDSYFEMNKRYKIPYENYSIMRVY